MRCERRIGIFRGVYEGEDGRRFRAHPIDCGSWSCPVCGSRKARRIYARAMAGDIAKEQGSYSHKLLTLTVPGAEYRATHSIRQAYNEGSAALTGLIKFLRYHYGQFAYLRVCELQKDGFPHWHVILVGDAIAPKDLLKDIVRYWRVQRGMGFVKLNRIPEAGMKKALGYVLKYLFKAAGADWGQEMKGARRYQGSREMLGPVKGKEKKVWVHEKLELGQVGRFIGVEVGQMCIKAEDELIDINVEGPWEQLLDTVLGPVCRPVMGPLQ